MASNQKTYFTDLSKPGPSSIGKDRFNDFVKFMDAFKRHMVEPKKAPKFGIHFESEFPGLRNLFRSLATWSDADRSIEWNPLSQRVYVGGLHHKPQDLVRDFSQVTNIMSEFVQSAHESAHVLLWEPFFVGAYCPKSKNDFFDLSVCFEGFCFWYADILITPRLRTYLPDGEFVFARTHVSQQTFHPYRVFKSLKIENLEEILGIYLDSFRGYKTKLLAGMSNAFVANLSSRIYGFYARSEKPTHLVYAHLKRAEIFGEFYRRFCQIPGLPSLLPEKVNQTLRKDDSGDFAFKVYKEGLPFIHNMAAVDLNKVRVRRMLQTRAYSGYSLRHVLNQEQVFSASNKPFDTKLLIQFIDVYLNQIELMMHQLAEGVSTKEVLDSCQKNDSFFQAKIRRRFVQADLWLSNRGLYFPVAKTPKSEIGLLSESAASSKKFRTLARHVIENYFTGIRKETNVTKKMVRAYEKHAAEIYEELSVDHWDSEKDRNRFISRFNSALRSPLILKQWSKALASVDPAQNHFDELLFAYE